MKALIPEILKAQTHGCLTDQTTASTTKRPPKKHLHMTEILLRKLLHVFIAVSQDFPTVRTNPIITVCIYFCQLLNSMKRCCQPRTRDREFCGGREIPGPLPRLTICRTTLLRSKEKSFISKILSACSSLFTYYLYEMLNELRGEKRRG